MIIDPEEVLYQEAVSRKDYLNGEPPTGGYKYGYALRFGKPLPEGVYDCSAVWCEDGGPIYFTWRAETTEASLEMRDRLFDALTQAERQDD